MVNVQVAVLFLLLASVVPGSFCGPLDTIALYELSQNSMNASLAASLFTADGQAYLPAGSFPAIGQPAIQQAYAGLFQSLVYLHETVEQPIIVNSNWAGLKKQFVATTAQNLCPINLSVITWFTFDTITWQIETFNALYDTALFQKQASC